MPPAKSEDPAAGPWHIDRRIPIAILIGLATQTAGAIWWASGVNASIADTKETEAAIIKRVEAVESAGTEADRRLVRFEVLLEGVTDQLKEQRQLLTQIKDIVGPAKK